MANNLQNTPQNARIRKKSLPHFATRKIQSPFCKIYSEVISIDRKPIFDNK